MADPRENDQVELILAAFEGDVVAHPPNWRDPDQTLAYLYRPDTVMARAEDAGVVGEALSALDAEPRRLDDSPVSGVVAFRITVPDRHRENRRGLVGLLDEVNDRLGRPIARPEHLLYVCGHPCPATEPEEVHTDVVTPTVRFTRPPTACCGSATCGCGPAAAGWGMSILAVDTGIDRQTVEQWPWTHGVEGDPDPGVRTGPQADEILPYGGHGTFVAGCARVVAPRADVFVSDALVVATGAAYERDIVAQIEARLDQQVPDVLVYTFATNTYGDQGLVSFDVLYEQRLRHLKGLAMLAPAGNDGWSYPMYPAAYDWVTGVGALEPDCASIASYSNHGPWVDVYAPGTDLVNAFSTGRFTCVEDPFKGDRRSFTGLARWSGTSFATPLVAGMVAARASGCQISAATALKHLLVEARLVRVPGVGPVLVP
ncbi:MAG: S8/S53 family peptidase [Kineosporiaceae bacterium]|nr:S8/S53 family peptidase [Kineosporiaceae bacterium]